MFLHIDRDEELLLAQLVKLRLRELEAAADGPAWPADDETAELDTLRRLSQRLQETEFDVCC